MSDQLEKLAEVVEAAAATTAPKAKPVIKTVITHEDGSVTYKCQYCGKVITAEDNVDNESGDYCRHLRENGYDDTALAELRQHKTVAEPPEGYIKVSSFHKICAREQIPVSAVVRAFGGDRGIEPALRPEWEFVYCGRARWVDPWTASKEGLEFLRSIARTPTTASTENALKPKKAKKSVKPTDELEAAIAEAITG